MVQDDGFAGRAIFCYDLRRIFETEMLQLDRTGILDDEIH